MMFAALLLAAAAPPSGTQQAFDAAEALMKAGKPADALAAYRALAARTKSPGTRAILKVREGQALIATGARDEAIRALSDGVAAMPAGAPLRHEGLAELGHAQELAFDYPAALATYRALLPQAPDDPGRLLALAGMARAGIWVDAAAAVADAERGLALARTTPAEKAQIGGYQTLLGRALLNAGRARDASTVLSQAVTSLGGLTARVDAGDIVTRSDKAIAAILAGDQEAARRTLAFTGAGRSSDGGIQIGTEMKPPPCGLPADADAPRPDDVVIVQFALADDGSVRAVEPIYASRPGRMVRTFLDAVSSWSWTPERLAAIKPFFRNFVRVELRCSTAAERPEPLTLALADMTPWASGRGIAPVPDGGQSAAVAIDRLRAELAERERRDGSAAASLLPVLAGLIDNPLTTAENARPLAERGAAIAATAGAPPTVLLWFRHRASGRLVSRMPGQPKMVARSDKDLNLLLADPAIAADARASAALRLTMAESQADKLDLPATRALLDPVIADQRLSPRDPLKVAANLRLATVASRTGAVDAARSAYERTGLTGAQCALVDARPTVASLKLSSSSYPMEAMAWGFEGWNQMELDVDAAGVPHNIRTVVGYPPFVFGDATGKGLARTRFTQSYRPEGGLGCGGLSMRVRFILPR